MSNRNGLAVLENSNVIELIQKLEIKPKEGQKEQYGIDISKEVFTWGCEVAAEIIHKAKMEKVGVVKVVASFIDDLAKGALLFSKFNQFANEFNDWSEQEGKELEKHLDIATATAFAEKGLIVEDRSTKLVLAVIGLIVQVVVVKNEFG